MSFNLDAFVRDECAARGIPAEHVAAVICRAEGGLQAAHHFDGMLRLTREQRIATTPRSICKRVVARAAADHEAGVLERLV